MFIVIAIIVVIGVLVAFLVNYGDKTSLSSGEQGQIQDFLFECFNSVYEDSLNNVGIQGGYYSFPLSEYLDTGDYNVPFYYFGELKYIPSIELMEEELVYAIETKKSKCLNLVSNFNTNYDFDYKPADVSIEDGNIVFSTNLELILEKDAKTSKIDFKKYPIEIKSNIKEMNNLASYIAYSYEINDESLCISCFSEIAVEKGFGVEFNNDFDNILMVSIIDNRTGYYPNAYSFLMTSLPVNKTYPSFPDGFNEAVVQMVEQVSKNEDNQLNIAAPKLENE